MDKVKLNYIVDIFLGLSFVITSITGLVIFFLFEKGVRQGGYQQFLGITKSSWSLVHEWAGMIMIILAILHLILHWKWIISVTRSYFRKK